MTVNPRGARFRPDDAGGHYESWFVRGNHPSRPLAFWVRYTVTSPRGRPGRAKAELFGTWFDGERGQCLGLRETTPLADAAFPPRGLDVRIGAARLGEDRLVGAVRAAPNAIAWDVHVHGGGPPLYLLPRALYRSAFPKAKALVMRPGCHYHGHFEIDGARHPVDGWIGSTNHTWGVRHTDEYRWGQVAGFDHAPETFLEIATARVRVAGVLTPAMTPIVLRHRGVEHRLNALWSVFGRAKVAGLDWRFAARGHGIKLEGRIVGHPDHFVAFAYDDPPGGTKTCVNSKIARCELRIDLGARSDTLVSRSRAAFEILTSDPRATGLPWVPA